MLHQDSNLGDVDGDAFVLDRSHALGSPATLNHVPYVCPWITYQVLCKYVVRVVGRGQGPRVTPREPADVAGRNLRGSRGRQSCVAWLIRALTSARALASGRLARGLHTLRLER